MPLTEKELLERDAKRDIGAELLQSSCDLATQLRCGFTVFRTRFALYS